MYLNDAARDGTLVNGYAIIAIIRANFKRISRSNNIRHYIISFGALLVIPFAFWKCTRHCIGLACAPVSQCIVRRHN